VGSPLEDGMSAGMAYCGQFELEFDTEALTEQAGTLHQVLSSWTGDQTDRFVHLLAHNFAVAAAARIAYEEPPLTEDELRSYLDTAAGFFNSWSHR
jgi:uncharacterized protein YceH (UPF0502 family)